MAPMVVSKTHHCHEILGRKKDTPSPNKERVTQPTCGLRLHMNSFMTGCGNELSLDPRSPSLLVGTTQELKNSPLKLPKLLFIHGDCSQQRKRSLETFMQGDSFCETKSGESSISGSVKRFTRSNFVTGSCLNTDSAENGKCNSSKYIPLDPADLWHSTMSIVSCLGMDESVDGCDSQSSNPENLILLDGSSVDSCDQVKIPSSKRNLKLITKDKNSPRPVIPKGPRFQAEIPEWQHSVSYETDADSKKWLGTRTWPIDGSKGENSSIGKGRPLTCSCSSPGSAKCAKYHIMKAKEELQSELGAAFFTWEFDKMGEVVAKSFSWKQEKKLESLLEDNPFSYRKDVWDYVMKHIPSKCESEVMSYYYNVFLPRRLSVFNRSSLDQVESDEDQAIEEDDDDEDDSDSDDEKIGGVLKGGIRRRWLR